MLFAAVFDEIIKKIKSDAPLVHHITNYVTANDSANTVLALGGRAVMADDAEEVEEMVSLASALVLNTGTLSRQKLASFLSAGKKANQLGIPVILDPVGLGSTELRKELISSILENVKLTAIRGNMSEIVSLSGSNGKTRGVDSTISTLDGGESTAKALAKRWQCVVAITGKIDIVSNGTEVYHIHNGDPVLSKITGTGCMSTSLIGVCTAAADPLLGTLLGLSIMGIAGETASMRLQQEESEGLGSAKVYLFDALSRFSINHYLERGKIHEKN